jgi:hypothetical protein
MRGEELEGIRSFLFVVDEVIHSVFVNLVILHLYARKQQFSPKKKQPRELHMYNQMHAMSAAEKSNQNPKDHL